MDEDSDVDEFLANLPEPEPITTVEEFEQGKARLDEALEEGHMEFDMYQRVLQGMVAELKSQWTRNYTVFHKDGIYAVHEIYLDDQKQICHWSEEPVYPTGETPEELQDAASNYYLSARNEPIEYTELVPDYEPLSTGWSF